MARPTAAQIVAATTLDALLSLRQGNVDLVDSTPTCIDCSTSKGLVDCSDCANSRYLTRCNKTSNSTHSTDCRYVGNCHHSTNCHGLLADRSTQIYGCGNCMSCDRIIFCDNLTDAKNMVFNVQLTIAQFTNLWNAIIVPALAAEKAAEDAVVVPEG